MELSRLTSDYLDHPEVTLDSPSLGLLSARLSGSRWWHSFVDRSDIEFEVPEKKVELDLAHTGELDESAKTDDQVKAVVHELRTLLKSKKTVADKRRLVMEEEYGQIKGRMRFNNPLLHCLRVESEVREDIDNAIKLCDIAIRTGGSDCSESKDFLRAKVQEILVGDYFVQSLSDQLSAFYDEKLEN